MNETVLGIPTLAWIPLLPLLGAAFNLIIGRKLSRTVVHVVAVSVVIGSFLVALGHVLGPALDLYHQYRAAMDEVHRLAAEAFAAAQQGNAGEADRLRALLAEAQKVADIPALGLKQTAYVWIEVARFKVELAFRLDTLSSVMILIVTGVGSLIHIYSIGYMSHDPRPAAFFGYLNLFMGAMLILVLGANLPVVFIGWEGVGLCSYLLIGFWYENPNYAYAGRKAFIVNRIGDFAFLLGMFLLYWATKDAGFAQSLDFADLRTPAAQTAFVQPFWGGERLAAAAGILLFIGACGKSAQVPLYVWLPDAMAGPTPVSALIHAATMVTAGVYMVCRTSFLFASSTTALIVVATIGTITAVVAAFMAFAQTDLKKVLAYSTVSQLGFMFVAAGTGNWVAAIFHLGTHAFFKAGLFLGAGSVMHGMGDIGDIRKMGGLRKMMPWTHACFLVYCLAIAGFPLTSGFFSKDEIVGGAFAAQLQGWPPYYGAVLGSLLILAALGTAFYMWRLYFIVFAGEPRSENAEHAHESPRTMTVPLVILAVLSVFAGWIGLPHLSFLHHVPGIFHGLSSWLEPSVKPMGEVEKGVQALMPHMSDGTTLTLMAIATAAGLLGIFLAWVFYGSGKPAARVTEWTRGPLATVYRLSKQKLYVDEIYDAIFVRPFRWLALGTFEIVDRFVIDTVLVNGSAFVVSLLSRLARWFQNGQVQRYIVGLVLGGALIFWVASRAQDPSFEFKRLPDGRVELRAQPGQGLAGNDAKLRWDLDGNGDPDRRTGGAGGAALIDDRVLVVGSGDLGSSVTLWIDSPLDGKTTTVTRDVPASIAVSPQENR